MPGESGSPPGDNRGNKEHWTVGAWRREWFHQAMAYQIEGYWVGCAWRWGPLRQAMPAARLNMRRWVPGGTRHPPGDLGAGSAWRHVSPAGQFYCCSLELLILYSGLQGFW
ncbi:hypothetical protein DEO72_LG1g2959 [Vigna unguiculata]|uniref:Uncharacterized protein n=1 Tax=Vigna unguiculata TaxID=3917 RepID=A0A4D6KRK2_VIGUN|nr:hypothetical protein DEO72_LG1g2959 [Vigna unguiculata]